MFPQRIARAFNLLKIFLLEEIPHVQEPAREFKRGFFTRNRRAAAIIIIVFPSRRDRFRADLCHEFVERTLRIRPLLLLLLLLFVVRNDRPHQNNARRATPNTTITSAFALRILSTSIVLLSSSEEKRYIFDFPSRRIPRRRRTRRSRRARARPNSPNARGGKGGGDRGHECKKKTRGFCRTHAQLHEALRGVFACWALCVRFKKQSEGEGRVAPKKGISLSRAVEKEERKGRRRDATSRASRVPKRVCSQRRIFLLFPTRRCKKVHNSLTQKKKIRKRDLRIVSFVTHILV